MILETPHYPRPIESGPAKEAPLYIHNTCCDASLFRTLYPRPIESGSTKEAPLYIHNTCCDASLFRTLYPRPIESGPTKEALLYTVLYFFPLYRKEHLLLCVRVITIPVRSSLHEGGAPCWLVFAVNIM